ncbi:replicative DNA helicase [Salinispora arenicola]|uniref:replicative DNA helicase n=1 Tax=Salinispora arenicola TaxID=168697 RepID=UPI000382C225|nr:replicative DNA helicase [Salinispora arenicola]
MEGGTVSVADDIPADPRAGGPPSVPVQRDGQFEKTPPQDIAAEQCVLGGMLLSKDAIADVVEILKSNDFYRPVHATVFDTILEIYGRGEPADSITVAAALADSGDLVRIGGAPYLHTLIASVPTAANAAYYARIVSERAVLRRLVEAGTRIVQLGFGAAAGGSRDVDDVVDLAQQAVYDVTERRVSEDFAVLADMLQPTLDEIEAVGAQSGVMTGVPTGFTDLDRLLNGLHAGQLIIVAGRPGLGKSTASMDFARNAAIRANQASAIFSLEMSKVEIVMRLLSAEARVPLHVLRSGQLSDDDWTKLARCMGEISEAPLFVDDTPSMNLMEIRAKARRLKQRHDLKLIVVDYLQLMTSPKRTESRQQEVADLSRGLKLLAKEVECPVIAVSQLNRGPEQRTDKRPQLSDLRESGCLTADTRLIRADTNAEVTLGELLRDGAKDVPVWALDDSLRYTPRTMTHVFPSGRRTVFRMTLASGKQIDATSNHPFLAFAGWMPLGELSPGTRIAVPRHVPAPLDVRPWADPEVVLLARLVGGRPWAQEQPVRYDLGSVGPHSTESCLPSAVFGLPKRQITLFLRHLWAAGGTVTPNGSRGGRIHLASPNRRILDDVSRLLLRYGITTRLTSGAGTTHRRHHTLDVTGRDDQLRFLREIGVPGEQSRACARLLAALESRRNNAKVTPVPGEVWSQVREVLTETGVGNRERAGAGWTGTRLGGARLGGGALRKAPVSHSRLSGIAAVLDTANLDLHATNDVLWDEIVSIESLGERDVYDATVLGTHNFIANGIATHNSIEQDADVVILLHRDDYYDKESPRAGEADFVVAKHRNGPTDTVTVAAQLHLSRFVDMAIV